MEGESTLGIQRPMIFSGYHGVSVFPVSSSSSVLTGVSKHGLSLLPSNVPTPNTYSYSWIDDGPVVLSHWPIAHALCQHKSV